MKIIHDPRRLNAGQKPVCVAIGVFDGVHLGHQQIIRQTVAEAALHDGVSLVITFDRHPNAIVAPDRVPLLIQPLDYRLRTIAALGAKALYRIRFDREFSERTGEAFVRQLASDVPRLRSVCVGADFMFGHKRSGTVALLRRLGEDLRFSVHSVAAVSLDGQPVSSTRIREAIGAGDFDAASQMLGRTYALVGPVIRGDQLGQQLGFPTANLDVSGLALPPTGVYAVKVAAQGKAFHGVMNVGFRPTLREPRATLHAEVHLLEFSGDLYGAVLEVTFVARLREERRFASHEALRAQIARDVAEARTVF